MIYRLAIATVAALFFVLPCAGDDTPPRPTGHVQKDIEGWTVHIDDRLLNGPDADLGKRALQLLAMRLFDVKLALPADKVARLQKVPIWLDRTHGKLRPAQYHPSAGWLKANGYDVRLAKAVHIPDAAAWASTGHQRVQPWSVLHELAHAYHDQVLGFGHPGVAAAWARFKDGGKYEKTLHINGHTTRHYALTNPQEFFAEMTEAFFGTNDFYPFNRAELRQAEPAVYALLEQLWLGKPAAGSRKSARRSREAAPAQTAQDGKAKPERLGLWDKRAPLGDGKFEAAEAWITVHRPEKPNGTAVVICPGGGYGGLVTGPEGHGIAAWLNRHGITGVVLEYRLPKGRPQVPLLDAQRAIRVVRARAKDWGLDPARIGIMGFSAGGHLASTAGTRFDAGEPKDPDPAQRVSSRPDFLILVYPVISMGPKGHGGSRANLLGKNPDARLVDLYSNEKRVTPQTPPTFLAHARDDRPVPPENSRMFHDALRANKVKTRYLELPSGGHGLNGYRGPMWDAWQAAALEWLAENKLIPASK